MIVRQALATCVGWLHYLILGWGIAGWAVPATGWLTAYLIAMPLIALQWLLNRNTCILNNLQAWLSRGVWRDAGDAEQGGFIAGLIARVTGRTPSAAVANALSYGLLALFWMLAWAHLAWRGDLP